MIFSVVRSLTIASLFFFSFQAQSQNHKCGTDHFSKNRTDAQLKDNEAFEKAYLEKVDNYHNTAQKRSTKYTIPIVFHVIHEGGLENVSTTALEGLVEQVNEDFSLQNADTSKIQDIFKSKAVDCEIEIVLAKKDPEGNCTNGITRTFSNLTNDVRDFGGNDVKSLIKWDQKKYLNVWIVKSIQSSGVGITLGYAYYPGTSPRNDGIVLRYDQTNTNSLTHEIGHYLNLIHTFEDGCFGGDRVSDTPPTADINFGCPRGQNSCSNDSPDLIDQIENYMDYSDCDAMFTLGQKLRMHTAIEQYRSELVSDTNLEATGVNGDEVVTEPIANFNVSNRIICTGSTLVLENISCSHTNTSDFLWELSGPQDLTSTEESPSFSIDSTGFYDVKLTITNVAGTSTKTIKNYISVRKEEGEINNPFATSFDNLSSLPSDWSYHNPNDDFGWEIHEKGYNDTKCLYVNNFSDGKASYKTSFILPTANIVDFEDQFLRYNLAYARINDESNDALNIHISLDCGATWRLISTDVSKRLSTTGDKAFSYVPTDQSQWDERALDLSRYSKYDILIKFEFISKNGNNIFIDNLRIGTTEVGFDQLILNETNICPNPTVAGNPINISLPQQLKNSEIILMDVSGKEIMHLNNPGAKFELNTQGWRPGIYSLVFRTDNGNFIKKIIIE